MIKSEISKTIALFFILLLPSVVLICGVEIGRSVGRQQIIKEITLSTYNQVKHPIQVDTIWTKGNIHFDTTFTYIITKSKENGRDYVYSVTLPDGTGYDFLSLEETDSVLQGFELTK